MRPPRSLQRLRRSVVPPFFSLYARAPRLRLDKPFCGEFRQNFITLMDALKLKMRAKDQLHPILTELVAGYTKFPKSSEWQGRPKLLKWCVSLDSDLHLAPPLAEPIGADSQAHLFEPDARQRRSARGPGKRSEAKKEHQYETIQSELRQRLNRWPLTWSRPTPSSSRRSGDIQAAKGVKLFRFSGFPAHQAAEYIASSAVAGNKAAAQEPGHTANAAVWQVQATESTTKLLVNGDIQPER